MMNRPAPRVSRYFETKPSHSRSPVNASTSAASSREVLRFSARKLAARCQKFMRGTLTVTSAKSAKKFIHLASCALLAFLVCKRPHAGPKTNPRTDRPLRAQPGCLPLTSIHETQLRREFLDPFFKSLGWDI